MSIKLYSCLQHTELISRPIAVKGHREQPNKYKADYQNADLQNIVVLPGNIYFPRRNQIFSTAYHKTD